MSSVLLSFKTDDQTKQEIKNFAAELGMPMTTFINTVVRQALRDRRVVLSTGLEPTPYLKAIIKEAEADYKAGRNITATETDEETLSYLRSL